MVDNAGFVAALGDIEHTSSPAAVRQRSGDMSLLFSPVMRRELAGRVADLVVRPRSRDELVRVAAAAACHAMPLIARGGGTCNFGQGIPLQGGAIVDTTLLDAIVWTRGPRVRAQTGARLIDIDRATRPTGWELRMHPSTKRASTLGGFVGGGHAGIGSCAYGILRDHGNILAIEMISVEPTPRTVELRGSDVLLAHHAYGTNGLITEIEMPLAPAWAWREAVVTFTDFMAAVRFGHALAASDGIVKKLVSIAGWPLPSMMRPLAPLVPEGRHMVLCMIAAVFEESFNDLVRAYDGTVVSRSDEGQGEYGLPIYEFAWGHARFHVNKVEPAINDVIGLFPPNDLLGSIERCYEKSRGIGPLQLEFKRFDGELGVQGSPFFFYVDDAQLAEIIAGMEQEGIKVANSHVATVRGGGMKDITAEDMAFKRLMDPFDLLNRGKLNFTDHEADTTAGNELPATGWRLRSP